MIGLRCIVVALLLSTPVLAGDIASHVALGTPATSDLANSGLQRLFVELDAPSVAELSATQARRGVTVNSRTQQLYAYALSRAQQSFLPQLRQHVSRIDKPFRVAINGFKVIAPIENIAALSELPGVKSVRRLMLHTPELHASVPWIGAPSLWSDSDGSGVTVAIIDTGIDYTHKNFGGSGEPLDFLLNDPFDIEPGTFPTDKVIGGYDFAGPVYDARDDDAIPEPDPDPIDRHGHGSHVAGIVAGAGVGAQLGAGVAPGAKLFALKVFSDEGGSTDLVTDAIEMALDPDGDGAIDDRVDVINMSLGATFGDPSDPSAIAAANAVANGVIVVASAGNRSGAPYVTGAPAVAPDVISVAASWSGNRTLSAIAIKSSDDNVNGRHESRQGLGPVTIAAQPSMAHLVEMVSPADDGNGLPVAGETDDMACHPAINVAQLQGQIALVRRGNCSYADKYINAQLAGAMAIIVFNDGTAPNRMGPQTMTGLTDTDPVIAIPGVMISFPSGLALSESLHAGANVLSVMHPSITVPADTALDDTLASFSSSGPGHGGSLFKPDITAPGRGILSTLAGSGFDSVAISGTSMAAPHVAGAAAILRQRYPDLSPLAIKSLLQNSAVNSNSFGPGTDSPYPLTRQGAGIMRLDRAATLSAYVTPAGVSFGRINNDRQFEKTVQASIVNAGKQDRQYTVTAQPGRTVRGVTVSCPDDFALAAGQTLQLALHIEADPTLMPYDRGSDTQTEVDGWCHFDDSVESLRIAYLAVVDPASMMRLVSFDNELHTVNTGPARGFAERFTLSHRGGPIAPANKAAVAAVGFRARNLGPYPLIEFGFAMHEGWESPAHLSYEIYIDADEDGIEDSLLIIADWSHFGGSAGSMVSAQYPLNVDGEPDFDNGYLDWIFGTVDFNDQVMIVPFTLISAGGTSAFLPDGDSDFSWRMVVTTREGAQTTQTGFIDLLQTVADSGDAIWVDPKQNVQLPHSAWPGLLLYPNNPLGRQYQTIPATGLPIIKF